MASALVVLAGVAVASPVVAQPAGQGTVCLVADPGGFEDASFNSGMLVGAEEASRRLNVELVTADPGTEAGIADTVEQWATSGDCDLIMGAGFIAGGAMEASVAGYPDQRFSVIDYVFQTPGNAASVTFRADQPAFMAGYVAAASSSTGIVATYGAIPFSSVTDFMNGYALGVQYFNTQTGGSVEVLGWDVDTQTGVFSMDFADPAVGFTLAEDFFDQGADTVLPVAGYTGVGSYDAAVERKSAGAQVRVVWPDIDPFELFDRDRARVLLTTAEKNVDVASYAQIESLVDGTWTPGIVVEDLTSGGVGLAPFHRTNNQVPGFVRPGLRHIEAGIVSGTIPTLP